MALCVGACAAMDPLRKPVQLVQHRLPQMLELSAGSVVAVTMRDDGTRSVGVGLIHANR